MGLCSLPPIYLGPNYGGDNEDNGDLSKGPMHVLLHSVPPTLEQTTADPCLPRRLLNTPRQVWVSLLWGHCSFLLGPSAHKVCLCPPRVYFPVLGKFWQLYGGVNGDPLQEGLCHTQVCCNQSPCTNGSPLLIFTSTGDTQTQFCPVLSQSLWLLWSRSLVLMIFNNSIIITEVCI